ncbi:type I restriction endonuclease [Pseudomonas aeruginosa]|uniref:type I restriction endonuclease n=1 Tax=Pseudomonas aeruginosa TaxID=287 RepID=UPI00201719A5|nr:type I restriction endonuclease [Pseudomonas aeruginosa]
MKSVNFEFLRPGNELLANLAGLAEAVLHIDPGSALTRLRSFAEELTKAIYKEELLPRMPQSSFYDLVKNPVFVDCVSKPLVHQINFLRIQGNDTAHGAEGDLRNAQLALKTAYQLAMYMAIKYYGTAQASIPAFTEVKDPAAMLASLQKTVSSYEKELNQQQEALQSVMDKLEQERTRHLDKVDPPAKPDQQKRQQQSQQVADSLQWNEAKTRALLIDAMLLQAGWDVSNPAQVGQEVDVDFPGNVSGKGRADYVLWGDNGQPLAVIEAKKSGNLSLQAGREQARMYADGFERMGMQRPVIFYSNGYETLYLGRQAVQHLPPGVRHLQQGQPRIPRLSAPVPRPHPGETQPRAEHCRPPLPDRSDQNCRRALPAAAPQSPDHPGHRHR